MDPLSFLQISDSDTATVAYKKIRGRYQPDITLFIRSKLKCTILSIALRQHGSTSYVKLPFRVETEYKSEVWERCTNFSLRMWPHTSCTPLRVQFCPDYCDNLRVHFVVRVGNLFAITDPPIVVHRSSEIL